MGMFVYIINILVMITNYKNFKTFSFPASVRTKLTNYWTNTHWMVNKAYNQLDVRWGKERTNKYVIKEVRSSGFR